MAQARVRNQRLSPYAYIHDQLDLHAALAPGLERNDLLPPRPDDRAGGEVAERFVRALDQLIVSGRYEPDLGVFVSVPKPSYASRPAALLTASDKVVFWALVEPLRARIERSLVSDSALLWPRAETTAKRWPQFETSPMSAQGGYIVRADVGGFYESIDHETLGERLVHLTGRTDIVAALLDFLGQVMRAPRGIPQGLAASDVLATAYLSSVDSGMLRHGYAYWRHGDDIRITVQDHDGGRLAVHRFEALLRSIGLLLNSDKTRVLHRETYARQMRAIDAERTQLRTRLAVAREKELLGAGVESDDVVTLIERAGIDRQTQWDLFYHGSIGLEDIVEQLRPHLEPDDVTLAAATFEEALSRAPDTDAPATLSPEMFHGMLSSAMTTLIAARDATPLASAASLALRFPSETELVATYLRALAASHPSDVAAEIIAALSGGYTTGWQQAWLLGALRGVVAAVDATAIGAMVEIARTIATDEESSWLARAEGARLLADAGELDQDLLTRLWARAPAAVRPDLALAVSVVAGAAGAAGAAGEDTAPAWAVAFRDSLRDDPMLQVVLNRAR